MRSGLRIIMRSAVLASLLLSLTSVSSAYYYWIFFPGNATSQRYPAKFDLSTMPDRAISYFISDKGPGKLVDGDNYDALVSQIRLAAETWNGVTTSDLRLRFGGFSTVDALQAAPGIDVVFDDNMPPGLLAQTLPSMPTELAVITIMFAILVFVIIWAAARIAAGFRLPAPANFELLRNASASISRQGPSMVSSQRSVRHQERSRAIEIADTMTRTGQRERVAAVSERLRPTSVVEGGSRSVARAADMAHSRAGSGRSSFRRSMPRVSATARKRDNHK